MPPRRSKPRADAAPKRSRAHTPTFSPLSAAGGGDWHVDCSCGWQEDVPLTRDELAETGARAKAERVWQAHVEADTGEAPAVPDSETGDSDDGDVEDSSDDAAPDVP